MKNKLLLILAFITLSVATTFAQTQGSLPAGSVLFSNNIFKDPTDLLWTGKAGGYIQIGSKKDYEDLIKAGYSKAQVDSIAVEVRKRSTHTGTQAMSTIDGLQDALSAKINSSEKGAINGVATLNEQGKIPNGQIPAIALTETFVVNSQAEMLALSAERGDVAVRNDLSKSFILQSEPATSLSNWIELQSPSVENTDQVPEGSANLYFTQDRVRNTLLTGLSVDAAGTIIPSNTMLQGMGKLQSQINNLNNDKADIDGDNATGTWPINVNGNAETANTAALWNGLPRTAGIISNPGYIMATIEGGENAGIVNKSGLRSFLDMPANGETLQSILDRGSTASGSNAKINLSSDVTSENVIPPLGSTNYKLYLSNGDIYGMQFGVTSSGTGYIQQARTDGQATAYNLLLNPNGGNVGIWTSNPLSALHANGVITATGGNSTQWNEAYSWGDYRQFGLGGEGNQNTGLLSSISKTSVFNYDALVNTDAPSGYGSVWTHRRSTTEYSQIAASVFGDGLFFRGSISSDAWRRVWSNGDFSTTNINNWNQAYSDRVTTNTAQAISGDKTFNGFTSLRNSSIQAGTTLNVNGSITLLNGSTFSSSGSAIVALASASYVTVPTPTGGNHAVTKDYVDSKSAVSVYTFTKTTGAFSGISISRDELGVTGVENVIYQVESISEGAGVRNALVNYYNTNYNDGASDAVFLQVLNYTAAVGSGQATFVGEGKSISFKVRVIKYQ